MEMSWKATTKNVEMNFLYALVLHIVLPTLLETTEFLIKVDVPIFFSDVDLQHSCLFLVFVPHYATGQFDTNPEPYFTGGYLS